VHKVRAVCVVSDNDYTPWPTASPEGPEPLVFEVHGRNKYPYWPCGLPLTLPKLLSTLGGEVFLEGSDDAWQTDRCILQILWA
jgi:hypothetical protein